MFNLKYLETNPNLEPIENDCLEISAVQFWPSAMISGLILAVVCGGLD